MSLARILPTSNHLWGAAALALSLGLLLARPLAAQESAQTLAARTLFEEGRQLMSQGHHTEACVKFEESQRLRAGIGTAFNLAECYEKTGRSASAWSLYLRVAAETKAQGQAERERVARERADALAPKLARLRLSVSKPVAGLAIRLDGEPMSEATWGIATPIDPGEHAVSAEAPGHQPWQGTAQVLDSAGEVSVEVPALSPLESGAAGRQTASSEAVTDDSATAPDRPSARSRRTAYIVGGVGIAGVLIGGLFGLRALDQNGEAEEICVNRETRCPPADIERHRGLTAAARSARTAGFVSLGIGLVGLGVSAVWLFSGSPNRSSDKSDIAATTLSLGAGRASGDVGLELSTAF